MLVLAQFEDDSAAAIGKNLPYVYPNNPYDPSNRVGRQNGAGVPPILGPTYNSIERYQITLWLSIGLALIMLAAVYAVAMMDNKKDTMLYSSFNPLFEDKKSR